MRALLVSAGMMAAVLAFAIPVNLALGRVIHWDIVTMLGLLGLAGVSLINHQQFNMVEGQVATTLEIQQTPRRGHHDIDQVIL